MPTPAPPLAAPARRSRRPPAASARRRSRPAAVSSSLPPASSARAPPACAAHLRRYSARDSTSCSSIQPRRADSSNRRCPSAPAHWSVFCLAETSRAAMSAGPTAQPSRTPGKNVFEVVPACTTTSGARLQRLGSVSLGEAQLAVRDVLDDQEAVVARELDQRRAPLRREADAGRVLVVGDRVDELRAQPVREAALELVDLEPVLVDRDGDERRLEAPERLDRAEVGRAPRRRRRRRGRGTTCRSARAPRSRRS